MKTPIRSRQAVHSIAEIMTLLPRALTGGETPSELNPAQWSALRYIEKANPSARTVGAFSKFHFTTASSASQTISSLCKGGYLQKHTAEDGRSRVLQLTGKGRRTLDKDPLQHLTDALLSLSDAELTALTEAVVKIMRAIGTP